MGNELVSVSADGPVTPRDREPIHSSLWDPRTLPDEVWQQVGVDPTTLATTIGGLEGVFKGFKRCGGRSNPGNFALDVWSQMYTLEDFRRKHAGVEFVPISIAGREGMRFRPITDRQGDQCDLLFPAEQGSLSVTVLRLDHHSSSSPFERAAEAAAVIVPLLPR
ncbi:DUF3558 family protein [Nocardia macrotermitis]|uniref:Uncharacterized protein n=1 Tax=Nocardia macrotermitis TaxID=2585198 RepID=A0A7K0DF28_9NOCA|nr:DUF3558 family protein [Nocardia macrotermitis]MQY24395.1 hypothetical protein [Nocardia macrotermitis]